ncbi:RagB/SusD family nutrient uptake outer membrane protein [Bacteroides faecium]|uniref:RagB/SusD family nutrient uptake outer membrane protein n=1 Tax=Bacteroides faecium TaxID=2715212 RepID=A0A6H0KP83_9BACE|nr:RagB/SusD family nutrient uptake outer membrane protein [Bacteroides faecium]QIU94197.1 RagB/SusD family nutrient uptake outer membrane protein [Bacteroides faecium]
MTKAICNLLILFIITVALFGCSEKEDEKTNSKNNVNGTIEKGPFLTGSKVTLYELDENLNQTGKNFRTETINDKGDFSFSEIELSGRYIELEISGYFYNEIIGRHSNSQINLNAITDLSGEGNVNVNILTHLEFKRVKKLMKEGSSFLNAKRLAEKELLQIFHITTEFKNPEKISLTDGDENAAMLLAISSILLYNKSEGEFSEFISKLSNEFAEEGTITSKLLLEEIYYGETGVNALSVMDNIKKYYRTQETEVVVNNIRKYIDGNGDGVLDENDETIGEGTEPIPPLEQDNEKLFKEYLKGTYVNASNYFQLITILDAVRCKQVTVSGVQINPYNTLIESAWTRAYSIMKNIHTVLEHDCSGFSFDVKPYVTSLRLYRGLIYLDMVQHWGGVPLVTSRFDGNDFNIPRASKKEVLAFIVSEITDVLSDLPEANSDDDLIFSKDLARAVLANAMLEEEIADYQGAATLLKAIIDNDKYTLLGTNNLIYKEKNMEELFSLELIAPTLFPLFEEVIKHDGSLHPIYRFTGVMLNYAQSLYRLGAYDEMKTVISQIRASLDKEKLEFLPESDACTEVANLWQEIINKDYGYFALLKQLELAVPILGIEGYETLYPIPARELDLNSNMIQNPHY